MNALAGRDVAITSPIPGTTRDLIEVFLDLRGYPVILVDTAGIRDADDPIEQEGVARARRRAESADLTLVAERWRRRTARRTSESPALQVRTKIDINGTDPPTAGGGELAISAKTGAGVDRLLDVIAELAEERMSSREPALLTLERHRCRFQDARQSIGFDAGAERGRAGVDRRGSASRGLRDGPDCRADRGRRCARRDFRPALRWEVESSP